jgi:hypothetical protein
MKRRSARGSAPGGHRARVVVGEGGSMRAAILAAADAAPLLLVNTRAWRHLVRELGGDERALRFLLRQAERTKQPIGINLELEGGESKTYFLAPRGWTQERLAGWIAGHREVLEGEFGEISKVSHD